MTQHKTRLLPQEISIKEISFGGKIADLDIKTYLKSLDSYRKALPDVLDLKQRVPIF
jgi:hypothetical protein